MDRFVAQVTLPNDCPMSCPTAQLSVQEVNQDTCTTGGYRIDFDFFVIVSRVLDHPLSDTSGNLGLLCKRNVRVRCARHEPKSRHYRTFWEVCGQGNDADMAFLELSDLVCGLRAG